MHVYFKWFLIIYSISLMDSHFKCVILRDMIKNKKFKIKKIVFMFHFKSVKWILGIHGLENFYWIKTMTRLFVGICRHYQILLFVDSNFAYVDINYFYSYSYSITSRDSHLKEFGRKRSSELNNKQQSCANF